MNKLLIFFAPALLFSCQSENDNQLTETINETQEISETIEKEDGSISASIKQDSVLLKYGDKTNQTTVDFFANYYLNTSESYQDSVNKLIEETFLASSNTKNANFKISEENFIKKCADAFIDSYETYKANENQDYNMGWDMLCKNDLTENETFVEVGFNQSAFLGGAHPSGSERIYHFDKETGKRITLKDMFTDVNELTKIGEKHFRETHKKQFPNIKNWNDEGFWFEDNKFILFDNFSINAETIYFPINQYDIAPYAAGTFDFEIPRNEVEHLLRDKYKK